MGCFFVGTALIVGVVAEAQRVGMARINIDDDLESQDQFWNLLGLVPDRDAALGKLVRFFRLAQKAWGKGDIVTREELESKGLVCMIDSGWAVLEVGGYQALGAKNHFAWYRQRVEAGQKRSPAERDSGGRFAIEPPADDQRNSIPHQPLAPSLAPAPVLKNIYINEKVKIPDPITREAIAEATEAWLATLKTMGMGRNNILPGEDYQIATNLQTRGLKPVLFAFRGICSQRGSKNFDPTQFVSLTYVFKPGNFERLMNLGVQAVRAEDDHAPVDTAS